jgi:hypothetical protein
MVFGPKCTVDIDGILGPSALAVGPALRTHNGKRKYSVREIFAYYLRGLDRC